MKLFDGVDWYRAALFVGAVASLTVIHPAVGAAFGFGFLLIMEVMNG